MNTYPHVAMHATACELITARHAGEAIENVLMRKMAIHNAWNETASEAKREIARKYFNANYFT